jgi:hypothetical protein
MEIYMLIASCIYVYMVSMEMHIMYVYLKLVFSILTVEEVSNLEAYTSTSWRNRWIDEMASIINNDYSLRTDGWLFFFEKLLAYLMRIDVEFQRKSQISNSKESN